MNSAFTYNGDLQVSELDWIRFTIGDTDIQSPLLYDQEINTILTLYPDKRRAAQACMESILVRLAKECDHRIGPISVSASDKYKNYLLLYEKYKKEIWSGTLGPQAPETRPGSFNIGMMDSGSW